ncbi:MAG: alanine--tRNA ligase [Patescibacteria group bacterium]
MITTNDLREKFINFFEKKGHVVIPSASLIPENDPSVLFTTAGMHPLVPYLMGEKHPAGNRLVDCQKCIRTGDIDEVGDNRHLTFFEMLGNWSLGDYFKQEAIEWSFEFLTSKNGLGLDAKRLFVTVFRGDDDAALDEETIKIWQEQFTKAGIAAEVSLKGVWENENTRIFALGKEDNWWGLAAGGPCGPCSEMFYDVDPEKGFAKNKTHAELVKNARFVEIWNDVFMEYDRGADGKLSKLQQKNVDTGMGLERTTAILNSKKEVFDINEFEILFNKISDLSGNKYLGNERAFRIIVDHLRTATFVLGDNRGIEPSNVSAGYVLRRLIRRAIRYGKQLGIKEIFTFKIAEIVIGSMAGVYPELKKNKEFIVNQLIKEEEKFKETLENGLREFEKLAKKNSLNGKEAFVLFSSYGFPFEMTSELAEEKGLEVSKAEFDEEFVKHQDLSRTASAGMFKGGLADSSEETKKLHTAAHLLLESLRQVLGGHVFQKGSNINSERLRFDFSHPQKMLAEEIVKVENLVNEQIQKKLAVEMKEMSLEEAKNNGAMGVFEAKYGANVKVYSIGDFSKEICGGPHVDNTAILDKFKIIKEEASSAGVRRIKAILEK